jgi:hypothetical protein
VPSSMGWTPGPDFGYTSLEISTTAPDRELPGAVLFAPRTDRAGQLGCYDDHVG